MVAYSFKKRFEPAIQSGDKVHTLRLGMARGSEYNSDRLVRIILTIAHLDQNPSNNADDNLAALCQRCHNRHDAPHRRKNAAQTRRLRKAHGDLFDGAGNG